MEGWWTEYGAAHDIAVGLVAGFSYLIGWFHCWLLMTKKFKKRNCNAWDV